MPNEDRLLVLDYMQATGSRLEYGGLSSVLNFILPSIYNIVYTYSSM